MKLSHALCLAICIAGVYCDEQKGKLPEDRYIKECTDESKVDRDIRDDMRETLMIPDNPELKCFLGCMLRKRGMINADGTFTDQFTDKDCKKGGNNACEVGYNTARCVSEKIRIRKALNNF